MTDTRIEAFQTRVELFFRKDVLDIGCNIGHITYLVARDLGARTVLGIDIDNSLIQIARKNVKHYICHTSPVVTDLLDKINITSDGYGNGIELKFPNNVSFLHVRTAAYCN